MHKKMAAAAICIAAFAMSAEAQNTFPATGNVGIGTTGPVSPLTIVSSNGPQITISNTGAAYLAFSDSTQKTYRLGASYVTGGDFALFNTTNGTYPFYVNPTGNVGIGTASPAYKFQVVAPSYNLNVNSYTVDIDRNLNLSTNYGYATAYRVGNGGQTGNVQPFGTFGTYGGNAGVTYSYIAVPTTSQDITGYNATSILVLNSTGNVGIGTTTPGATDPNAKLEVKGGDIVLTYSPSSPRALVFSDGTSQTTAYNPANCGADYAEAVDVSGDRTKYEPGDILVIDPDAPGKFLKSNQAYSPLVAGIYSTKPGFVGRLEPVDPKTKDKEVPMAMVGRVPTKVSAENGPIKVGDLLVSSSKLGYAMKGTDRNLLTGAVIGKALGSLDSGTGIILALVNVQ